MSSPQYIDVIKKYKNHNKILFNHNSISLYSLIDLIEQTNHRVLILWSFYMVDQIYSHLQTYNIDDEIILNSIIITKSWSKGLVKMDQAKRSILTLHSLAKKYDNPSVVAKIHAIGQGLSTVHVKTHALGLVFYELTGIVHDYGIDDFEFPVTERISMYVKKLETLSNNNEYENQEWASFLVKNK